MFPSLSEVSAPSDNAKAMPTITAKHPINIKDFLSFSLGLSYVIGQNISNSTMLAGAGKFVDDTTKLGSGAMTGNLGKAGKEVASEFAGSGPVDGPGSGVSDSIPARLSDGEFVFTSKAVDQIGIDTLQQMMSDAEMEADGEMPRQARRMGGYMMDEVREDNMIAPEKTYDLDKAEVDDTNKRINDTMMLGGVPIR